MPPQQIGQEDFYMTKTRVKSTIMIALSLLFLSLPIVFSHTNDVGSVCYVIFMAVTIAFFIENYMTFHLIKLSDNIEFIYRLYFIRMMKCAILLYLFNIVFVGAQDLFHIQTFHFLTFFLSAMFLFSIILQGFDGIGNQYLCIGNQYIKLEDVEICDKTTSYRNSKAGLSYLIHMKNGKTHKINAARKDLKAGMEEILDEKLQVYEIQL